ncbi:unnamed protein product [Cyclocybe aegerita]|uniref:Uncharacterized protein n=1 Tax=Cyclocybe aegerita TaxID=1973307 RepID=A0A8S0VXA9_CYCAE|nr:unnamed protein product [Cyclocybe aegerita]
MRLSLLSLLLTTAISSWVCGASTLTARQCYTELECSSFDASLDARSAAPAPSSSGFMFHRKELTHGERIARGLTMRAISAHSQYRSNVARAETSSVPKVTYRGTIEVKRQDNGESLGYVSASTFNGAQYRYQAQASALIVTVDLPAGQTSGEGLTLTTENSDTGFPLLGLVQGRDNTNTDIASGSYHYLYLGGVSSPGTPPDSAPMTIANSYTSASGLSRASETSVWNLDLATGALSAQWTNTDLSQPEMQYWTQGTALYSGADAAAFSSRYPSPIIRLTYVFHILP